MAKAVFAEGEIGNIETGKDVGEEIAIRKEELNKRWLTWKRLCEEIQDAAADRNVLSHLPAYIKFNDDNSMSLELNPHVCVPEGRVKNRAKAHDAYEFQRLSSRFEQLAGELDNLANNAD